MTPSPPHFPRFITIIYSAEGEGMRLAAGSLPPSLLRHASFLSAALSKTHALTPRHHHHARRSISHSSLPPVLSLRQNIKHPTSRPPRPRPRPMNQPSPSRLSTAVPSPSPPPSTKSTKKARRESPDSILRHQLDQCSKRGDLLEALRLYDSARAAATPLSVHHYNVLLYLCSSPNNAALGLDHGFNIFRQMSLDAVPPNESTFTSLARLAAVKQDPALAFDIVKQMSASGIPPRLRSYGPALFGFSSQGDADGAGEVEAHMDAAGVLPEEPELGALLQVNVRAGRADHVYRLIHRMRAAVRQVLEGTAEVFEGWFKSDAATEAGAEEWDADKVREGVVKGGGGWHGQGWLGKGRWSVGRSEMDKEGVCRHCGEKLACIDIDPKETEDFARSLSTLACQREVKADFLGFQEWLDKHGPFDAVIDGANVGLFNQHNFNFFQLNSIVNGMRQMSPSKKLPLIVLHSRRVRGGPADTPNNKKLLESWQRSGVLYTAPTGSNDDWYWLYAAVSCRSLLVTNDEMRDHLFELLGTSFFPRWKEKHQVRLTFSKHGPSFHMPPPYSIVIQESERGSWHVPMVTGDDIETPRQWVCATRDAAAVSSLSHAVLRNEVESSAIGSH